MRNVRWNLHRLWPLLVFLKVPTRYFARLLADDDCVFSLNLIREETNCSRWSYRTFWKFGMELANCICLGCNTLPHLDALLLLTRSCCEESIVMTEVDSPNNALMCILQLLNECELTAFPSLEQGPHPISRTRQQVLITLGEFHLNNSELMTKKTTRRHRSLWLGQIPNEDIGILLLFGFAATGSAVTLLGSCNTEYLEDMTI